MTGRVFTLSRLIAPSILCAGLLTTAVVPRATADLWNEQTVITFNKPVEIPGRVLAPGTYVFVIANPASRDVVQIFDRDESQLVATELTLPAYRLNATATLS